MLTNKLTGAGAAAAADKTYIEDVFSTYLYTGNGSTQRINNGIQLGDSFSSGSGYFDGNSKVRSSSFPSISAGEDFTVEAFIYQTQQTSGGLQCISTPRISSGSWYFGIYLNNIFFYDESANTFSGTAVTPNTWIHAAYSRSGTTHRLFLNGVLVGTKTATAQAETGGALAIGSDDSSSTSIVSPFYGYISNLRVVKGTALYTANFTAPTAELTAVSGTSILCLQGTTPFIDKSTNSYTLTVSGNTKADVFGPFSVAGYGKGGMVWLKERTSSTSGTGNNHNLVDTVRGAGKKLQSNTTAAQATYNTVYELSSFTSTGFTLGYNGGEGMNETNVSTVSWTFRKAPKFFDVVTYTGNGASNRDIAHSLGIAPGMVIVKRLDSTSNWGVWHRYNGSDDYSGMSLNLTNASTGSLGATAFFNASTFRINLISDSASNGFNISGAAYVAYLFAHDTTTDGLIQCGSYTGNGSATGPTISLGWEPQYVMIKKVAYTGGNWLIFDNMRGMPVGSAEATLQANLPNAESSVEYVSPTATGFQITSTGSDANTSGDRYIYMAIRRGPMRTPTDGTKVFTPIIRTGTGTTGVVSGVGFAPDFIFNRDRNNTAVTANLFYDKLRGISQYLNTNSTSLESSGNSGFAAFTNDGVGLQSGARANFLNSLQLDCYFRRAPGFFDVVCYTATGSAQTVNHNLGVAPEFFIIKRRDNTGSWGVYSQSLGMNKALFLESNGTGGSYAYWGSTPPNATTFGIEGAAWGSGNFVAYLFASCPGVSKVGSYTGNGTSQTINCGFTNGARFVLIKRTDSTGDWYVWDTARGIVAANDPRLSLNSTAAEVTTDDTVDPTSTGFIVNQVAATNVNVSGGSYIYLAIA